MSDRQSPPSAGSRPSWSSRRLVRSRRDRMVGGVAGGIAETYDIDPTLVRLGFVVAVLLGGIGIVAYAAAWLLVPEADDVGRVAPSERDWITIGGLVLLGFGALALFNRVAWHRGNEFVWPLLLIGGGVAVLWLRVRDDERAPVPVAPPPSAARTGWSAPTEPAPAPERAPSEPGEPSEQLDDSEASDARASGESPDVSDTAPTVPIAAVDVPPASTAATTTAWSPPTPWPGAPAAGTATRWGPPPPRPPRPPRERSILGWLTMSVLLLGAGIVAFLDATGAIEVNPGVVVAGALVAIGVALIVGAFWGRARWLVLLAVPLTFVAAVATALDVPLRGGIGERTERPISAAQIDDKYELGIGNHTVDLRAVDLPTGTTRVTTNLGIGQLNVMVPRGVRVIVDGHADAGQIDMFGRTEDGTDVDVRAAVGPPRAATTLQVDANIGLGELQVGYDDGIIR